MHKTRTYPLGIPLPSSAYRRHEGFAGLLATTAVGVLALRGLLPAEMGLGAFCAGLGLTLLLQGLARDLAMLAHQASLRRAGQPAAQPQDRACICLESTVGLPLVLAGVTLAAATADNVLTLSPGAWPLAVGVVWTLGFFIRDLVLEWSPRLRVTRVTAHGAILVQWRAGRARR